MKPCRLKSEDWRKLKTLLINSCKESPDAFAGYVDENTPDHTFIGWANNWTRGSDEITFILSDNQDEWGIIHGGVGRIGHLWVDPKFRSKGYGKLLLDSFLDWARERSVSNIHAFVRKNSDAIGFYEKAGFISIGESSKVRSGSGSMVTMIEMKFEIH